MNDESLIRRLEAHPLPLAPATLGDADPQEAPVRRYLRVALRRRYAIIGAVAASLALALIVTLLMTPRYTARTTVEIARESSKIVNIEGVQQDASVADQEFYQTQYGLLRSQTLAERVATQLRLVNDPAFFQTFGADVATLFPSGGQGAAQIKARERVAGALLLENMDVQPERLSRLVHIKVTSPDAAFSAKVANAWATNFIQITLERRYQATSYARNFLESRLGQLRTRLEESERQLVQYASRERLINIPVPSQVGGSGPTVERSIIADDLSAINASLAKSTSDRIEAEARFRQGGRSGASTQALENTAINALRQRRAELAADYQKLMTQFRPEYPAAQALQSQIQALDRGIGGEEGRVSSSVAADYRQAVAREQSLGRQVEQLKSNLLDQRRRSIQYAIFQREVDTNRQLYDGLLQRYKEIGIAGGVGVNNVSIVDEADVPTRRSSPRLLLNLFLGLLAGLVIGGLAALVLEQIDEAIADPSAVQQMLGLPLLGSVPLLPAGTDPLDAIKDRKSDLVDAYLAVQTNLSFTTEHGIPRSLAVTSTRPAEGKSTSALALATVLARAQRKVVLVDGDMRSPSVHHLIGTDHDNGLSNFLAGEDDLTRLLLRSEEFDLHVMTAGPLPPNAAELLTGDRLRILIEQLLERFDHVVIDSPPVMGLADAPLIGSRVEGVVYAIESHGIRTGLVRTAIDRLRSAHVRLIGAIVTKFDVKRAHYSYGYEYGYGYGRDANGR